MDVLIEQERALHKYEVRQNQDIVARLLHPSFKEVGRSGNSYNYECIELEPSTELLLYKSAWVDESGAISAFIKYI
ncbi:hypothetical protein MED121_12300 [Marinomonas sp. MED121]|uniref:nuclear transport factor 2 family protein n=1 Tax=Marinomonas sp. MED121 TaxID=314277 RepID=UPI000068FEE3|nr:nuclear transport factor 2 family protein [Marinomonas sp. MED121]EAQ66706.1 hypothetical protein MED121_12300 [Marinomonas sp. MED121]